MTINVSACVLLATNLGLTFLSIYWSVSAWAALHHAQDELPWPRTSCLILNKSITTRDRRFRPEFIVTNFTQDNPDLQGTAYRNGRARYNETAESARAFVESKKINKSYPCWQSTLLRTRLSLSPVRVGVRSEHANLAAISTVLAIAAAFSLGAIVYLIFSTSPSLALTDIVTQPDAVSRTGLSPDSIDRLVENAQEKYENNSRDLTEEPVCAICLEEDNGARLDCGHAFHPSCIRTWLLRGGENCPLCCTSLIPIGGESGAINMPPDLADLPDMGADEPARYSSTRFPSFGAMHRAVLMADVAIMTRTQATPEIEVANGSGERGAASGMERVAEPERAGCGKDSGGCSRRKESSGGQKNSGGNDSDSDSDSNKSVSRGQSSMEKVVEKSAVGGGSAAAASSVAGSADSARGEGHEQ